MVLAYCLAKGEEEVICDLAETYHIYDYKGLPPSLVATLVVGLDSNSRIKRKLAKSKLTLEQSLFALIIDGINILIWQRTKDGSKGKNKPESLYKKLMNLDNKPKEELKSFKTIDEFEKWYKAKMRS